MANKYFRVRIKNYRNDTIEYEYFDTEEEAKMWCINRSDIYINVMNSYEDKNDHMILYQIQYLSPFDGYIPDYGITINNTAFSV